jgi:hypothetical protein
VLRDLLGHAGADEEGAGGLERAELARAAVAEDVLERLVVGVVEEGAGGGGGGVSGGGAGCGWWLGVWRASESALGRRIQIEELPAVE